MERKVHAVPFFILLQGLGLLMKSAIYGQREGYI